MACHDGQCPPLRCNWALGMTLVLLVGAMSSLRGQPSRAPDAYTTQQSGRGSSTTGSAVRLSLQGCEPYGDAVQSAVDSAHPPYLNQAQLLWIAAALQGRGAAAAGGGGTRFLVFGLGYDSQVWVAANCGGETIFLEDSAVWIHNVTTSYPIIKALLVSYRGRLNDTAKFFASPWLMEVPESVGKACWENILVDAPMGYKPYHPGRMESTYYAVHTARRCIAAGEVADVIIFLHDVQRPVESKLIARYLAAPDIVRLGVIKGRNGNLAAFRVVRPL